MRQKNKFIYEGRVLNNQDPLMLGRLRVYPTTPDPETDIYPPDWDESKEVLGMSNIDIMIIINYLERVVPRGNEETDELYKLISMLRKLV